MDEFLMTMHLFTALLMIGEPGFLWIDLVYFPLYRYNNKLSLQSTISNIHSSHKIQCTHTVVTIIYVPQ